MKAEATYQKLRGGYYTPKPIADFLACWAIQTSHAKVLEPSCGDGVLLEAAVQTLLKRGATKATVAALIQGVELDAEEAAKAVERLQASTNSEASFNIYNGDFFTYCQTYLLEEQLLGHTLVSKKYFDAIIGNPPFVRYQNFPEEHRAMAFSLMQQVGLHPTRLTNTWVPFLAISALLLAENGRLAMVIPAELLQVNYAAELRLFLGQHLTNITLITFKKLVFDNIQQEVVLLLGEKRNAANTGIEIIELAGMDELVHYQHQAFPTSKLKEMDHSNEKWTMYFLTEPELGLLRSLKTSTNLTIARDIIDVDVGVVTGLNEFFVLTPAQVNNYALAKHTQRIVGRSAQLQGTIFSENDWLASAEKQLPTYLLSPPNEKFDNLPETLKVYISEGEEKGWNKGYKCRIREKWYIVPSLWVPPAFMLRQIHHYPKIVVNSAAATCTDTIHRVRLRNGVPARIIAAAFLNSLTFAFAEITGRSYGGGVLELEPNEAERLPLPLLNADKLNLEELDGLLRQGDIYAVLAITDEVLLKQGLGLSKTEIQTLRAIWEKLRDRRINRK